MKKVLFFTFVIAALSACHQMHGSGNVITENRTPGNFTGIDVGSAFDVELTTGSPTQVRVEADDNVIKYIETSVEGNTLNIKMKDGFTFDNGYSKIYITAPAINNINSSGAAKVNIIGALNNTSKITLEASGAANINGAIDAPEVSAVSSGAANINVTGSTKNYKVEASGSSNIKSDDLKSEMVTAIASGASSLAVYSSVNLKADADGAASIHYKGAGSTVVNTSGAGSVKKDD